MHFATQLLGFDPEFLRESSPMVPSANTLCRFRFIVDCGVLVVVECIYLVFVFELAFSSSVFNAGCGFAQVVLKFRRGSETRCALVC